MEDKYIKDRLNERKLLAGMIADEEIAINAVVQLTGDDFYEQYNRAVYQLMESMIARGVMPTYVKLLQEALKYGMLESNQDADKLKYIAEHHISIRDGQFYIDTVQQASKRRKLERVITDTQLKLEEGKQEVDALLENLVQAASGIHAGTGRDNFDKPGEIAEMLKTNVDEKETRFQAECMAGQLLLEGVSTGFRKLDEVTLGYRPGDLIILAAQTGHGKSAFGLQTARTIAIDGKTPLVYVNTEMSKETVIQRIAANLSGVPLSLIRQGNFTGDGDKNRINRAVESLRKGKMIHRFAPNLTPARCAVIARQGKVQFGAGVVIVDYIGRMEKYTPGQAEWQVLEQVAKSMKLLAQELQIAVMVLAQLNDDGTLQGGKRIKNECDIMLKLLPLSKAEVEEHFSDYVNANYRLFVDKNRDGQAGVQIPLQFDKAVQTIVAAKKSEQAKGWESLGKVVKA